MLAPPAWRWAGWDSWEGVEPRPGRPFVAPQGVPTKPSQGWPVLQVGWAEGSAGWASGVRRAQRRGKGSPTFSSASSWRKSNGNCPAGGFGWGPNETLYSLFYLYSARNPAQTHTPSASSFIPIYKRSVFLWRFFACFLTPIASYVFFFWGGGCLLMVTFYPVQFYCCS